MSKQNKRILICAGGTGGHVFPAKKVAETFLENNFQVEWIGTGRGPEKNICDNLGIKFHQYQLAGFSGKSLYQKTKSLFLLFFSILKYLFFFQLPRLNKGKTPILCFGGYVSLIGLFHILGPVFLQEQNTIPGKSTKLISKVRKVKKVFCGFESALKFFPEKTSLFTGNPLNLKRIKISESIKSILNIAVIGGSQGSTVLNETVPKAIKAMNLQDYKNISIYHLAGHGNNIQVIDIYKSLGISSSSNIEINVEDFTNEIEKIYHNADLVISRSGALSVSEISAFGKVAIFVPLKNSIDNHQKHNAKYLEEKGAAFICEEDESLLENLIDILIKVYKDRKVLEGMMEKSFKSRKLDAEKLIYEEIFRHD